VFTVGEANAVSTTYEDAIPVNALSSSAPAEKVKSCISRSAILKTVARRSVPHLVEATIVPAVLFYVCMLVWGLFPAFIAAATWSYGAIIWRIVTRRPISSLLFLSTGTLTLRTIIAIASGSSFIYFLQPIMGTIVMAGVFFGSILFGQPLIGRLAGDFWPLTPEVKAHPAVMRLFRSLTILWACVNLAIGSCCSSRCRLRASFRRRR
jgi:hypothetical protein